MVHNLFVAIASYDAMWGAISDDFVLQHHDHPVDHSLDLAVLGRSPYPNYSGKHDDNTF